MQNNDDVIMKVFDEFTTTLKTLPRDGFVIAHSMPHENSIFMHNLDQGQRLVWKNAPKCDTHEPALLTYVPENEGYKKPRNCKGFGHMAGADVEMTWDIFQFYKRKVKSPNELKWPIICRGLMTKHKGL